MLQTAMNILQTYLEGRIVYTYSQVDIDTFKALRRDRLHIHGRDAYVLDLLASAKSQHHDRQHDQQESMCPISHNTCFYIFAKITIFVEKSYLCPT